MKYEDYKFKDLVFLTKEDWTEEEKREVIATFPESRRTEEKRTELLDLKKAVENGIVKKTGYYGLRLNKNSLKSYAKMHLNNLYYGNPDGYGSCGYNTLYIIIDGIYKRIGSAWDIENILEYLDDIDKRFKHIENKYRTMEIKYKNENEKRLYKEENRDRIDINRMANEYLKAFKIDIPVEVYPENRAGDGIPDYYSKTKRLYGYEYTSHNNYDEIVWNGTPITTEDAEKIIAIVKEATRKVELIIDRVDVELREIKEKYNEATQ